MKILLKAIFIPIMTYGMAIWGWRAQTVEIQAKFTKLLRSFCLKATRCMRSTSNELLFRLMQTNDFPTLLKQNVRRVILKQLKFNNFYENGRDYMEENVTVKRSRNQ